MLNIIEKIKGIVVEMAIPLRKYKYKVDGLRFNLIENWCLCKWCQLFNPQSPNFNHWLVELKACMSDLKFVELKSGSNKRKCLTRWLIDDYDYDDVNMCIKIITDKFYGEGIYNKDEIITVCSEFVDSIQNIIDVLSIDILWIQDYLNTEFKKRPR